MTNVELLEEIIDVVQDGHINFLIGSGLSRPYLSTVGNIERLLTELSEISVDEETRKVIEASIKKIFFEKVVSKNYDLIHGIKGGEGVLKQYEEFLKIWIEIILEREETLIGKQVNLFTSNYDIFLEKSLDNLNADFNDGFNGRLNPVFSTSNFNKIFSQKSLHFDNISEIPHFNLIKLHGSLTWRLNFAQNRIELSDFRVIEEISQKSQKIINALDIKDDLDSIENYLKSGFKKVPFTSEMKNFLEAYNDLAIINPTKAKFRETLLDKNYYDLFRIFSNELEKENSVLFILGFSMADEHIRQIIIRAAESNPTLMIYLFVYDEEAKKDIEKNMDHKDFKFRNLKYVEHNVPGSPPAQYDFGNINKLIFSEILRKIKTV